MPQTSRRVGDRNSYGINLIGALEAHAGRADEELTFDELPRPVQETAARETRGGRILEIEREVNHGVTEYEIEYLLNDVKYELDIAPDGTLLRRHRD